MKKQLALALMTGNGINRLSMNNLKATASVVIDAPLEKVWEALTTPQLISKYLFGTKTETTWKVGEPIRFRGEWQGKSYEDKGTILEFEPRKKLKYSYWSSMSGIEDKPENYMDVSFLLSTTHDDKTKLELLQEKIRDEKSRDHSEQNWTMVLGQLKTVAEDSARLNAF
jgi:uncharacterized protein YndB with AHSA1/START domain